MRHTFVSCFTSNIRILRFTFTDFITFYVIPTFYVYVYVTTYVVTFYVTKQCNRSITSSQLCYVSTLAKYVVKIYYVTSFFDSLYVRERLEHDYIYINT